MKEIFYKKVGRKYIPISEYHSNFTDSYRYGDFLVSIYKNGSTRKQITPDFAPVIAATRYSRDAISKAIMDASAMRPTQNPLSSGQVKAWRNLEKEFGDERYVLTWPSAIEAAEAAEKAMQTEADKMLKIPAVKAAYDHFMFVYQLTKETENEYD